MQPVEVSGIGRFRDEEVLLKGWLDNIRSSGGILFLELRDGTGIIQCIVEKSNLGEDAFEEAAALIKESSLEIAGTVREDSRAPGGYELSVTNLKVIRAAVNFPVHRGKDGEDFLMDHRYLTLRGARQSAILRIRAGIEGYIRDFFNRRGFVLCDAPIFTPGAGEEAATLFETGYFGDRAWLAGSGRHYNEAAAAAFRKVYSFGPVFRAQGSKAAGCLTEFWMVEPEVAFAGLEDIMKLAEDLLVEIVGRSLENYGNLLAGVLERDVAALVRVQPPFPGISYLEAVAALKKKGVGVEAGGELGEEGETALAGDHDRPLFVHRFPAAIKAFSVEQDPGNPELCLSFALLAPEGYGGIIGGGQRAFDLEFLKKRIEERRLPGKTLDWYLDLWRYGGFPHSGFALGLERTLAWICGAGYAGETIPFPRLVNRLTP